VISLINVNSPLRYDDRMLGALLEYPSRPACDRDPFLMAGAMSPMGLAGTLAQQTAEALAGMALVQIIRPGTPASTARSSPTPTCSRAARPSAPPSRRWASWPARKWHATTTSRSGRRRAHLFQGARRAGRIRIDDVHVVPPSSAASTSSCTPRVGWRARCLRRTRSS